VCDVKIIKERKKERKKKIVCSIAEREPQSG